MDFEGADFIVSEPMALELQTRKVAQKCFLSQRDRILAEVPSSLKNRFQQIGFVDKQPVLAVSPFSVPPGPIRTAWMNRFVELKGANRLEALPLIIYRYGHQGPCGNDAYSLVDASEWIPYKEGTERNFGQIPKHILEKVLSSKEFSDQDEAVLRPLREVNEALKQKPEDRHGKYVGFTEIYDSLTISLPPLNAALKIGSRVEVYKADRGYKALVEDIRHGFCYLCYDTECREWLPLAEHKYRVLPADSDGDHQVAALDPSRSRPAERMLSENQCVASGEIKSADKTREVKLPMQSNERRLRKVSLNAGTASASSRQSTSMQQHKEQEKQVVESGGSGNTEKSPMQSKDRQSRKVLMNTNPASGSSRPSAYLQRQEDRLTLTGILYPKKQPRRLPNGTFAKPPGRIPSYMKWNSEKGFWTTTALNAAGAPPQLFSPGKVPSVLGQSNSGKDCKLLAAWGKKTSNISLDREQSILRKDRENAKRQFERERNETLAALPDKIKLAFGQIGFSKWEKKFFPVLVLNPFDVPPGKVREAWVDMFNEVDRQEGLCYLIYWYGARDSEEYYGFIEQEAFIPYDLGVQRNYHEIPRKIQRKLDDAIFLTQTEKALVRGITEMKKDLSKLPGERRHGVINFPEEYELPSAQELIGLTETTKTENEHDAKRKHASKKPEVQTAVKPKVDSSEHRPLQVGRFGKRKMECDGVSTMSNAEMHFGTREAKKTKMAGIKKEGKMEQGNSDTKVHKKSPVDRQHGSRFAKSDDEDSDDSRSYADSSENELFI